MCKLCPSRPILDYFFSSPVGNQSTDLPNSRLMALVHSVHAARRPKLETARPCGSAICSTPSHVRANHFLRVCLFGLL
jgi:hypothetical protein